MCSRNRVEVILDTSFIVSCIKKNIDFLAQLEEQGFEVRLPNEVLEELKDLRLKTGREERLAIDVALELFHKSNIRKIKLGKKKVDDGLIDKAAQGYYIATLDKVIKRSVQHRVVIFDAQKRVGVE